MAAVLNPIEPVGPKFLDQAQHLEKSQPTTQETLVLDAVTSSNWTIPKSDWTPYCHPRVEEVSREVDGYFLEHWEFPNAKAERVFVNAGFSRVTCLYFPLAKDDRIHFACRLLTLLFLIDGMG